IGREGAQPRDEAVPATETASRHDLRYERTAEGSVFKRMRIPHLPRSPLLQRSSSNVKGRNGYLSLRTHARRGLDNPRKRACLTAVPNCLRTRPDGTTAAERFFGLKPRSPVATILASVELPPAPLSTPRRAVGSRQGHGVADAVIEAKIRP